MLTDQEMLQIAERYLKKLGQIGDDIEVMIYTNDIIKKTYGNIYFYNSKEYVLTGDFNKSLMGNAPFLVENKTGRVVNFSTSTILEKEIQAYEKGTILSSSDLYWYPDEDRFSSK